MSEDELEQHILSTEDDDSKADEGQFPIRRRKGKKLSELRHPRQKYCPQWESDFPWLRADRVDESLGFCIICHKHLVCKKSHLERHQESFRHMRLHIQTVEENGGEGFTVSTVINGPEDLNDEDGSNLIAEDDSSQDANTTEFLECGKRIEQNDDDMFEYDDNYDEEQEAVDGDTHVQYLIKEVARPVKRHTVEITKPNEPSMKKRTLPVTPSTGHPSWPKKSEKSLKNNVANTGETSGATDRLDRFKLLKQIDHDRHTLSEYLCDRRIIPFPTTSPLPISKPRDALDIFFESVSASVKVLPPKLAAELKGRISQLIAEYEMRSICEQEENEAKHLSQAKNEMLGEQPTATTTIDANGMPNIVYTFEPKVHNEIEMTEQKII